MSAFARIASEIFPEDAPEPADPIGKVIAILKDSVTAAIPRELAEREGLLPFTPVCLGAEEPVYGTIVALDALLPATTPQPDDVIIAEIDIAPVSDASRLTIGAAVRPFTPDERYAMHSTGVMAPLPIGEADWGNGPVPFVLDAQALLGAHTLLTGPAHAGKSCTLSVVFRSLLRTRFSGRLLLIDPLSGFARSFGGGAEIVDVSAGLMPFGMMTPEEVAAVIALAAEPLSPSELAELRGLMRRPEGQGPTFRPSTGITPTLASVIDTCHRRGDGGDFGDAARSLGAKLSIAARDPRLSLFFGEVASTMSAHDVLQTVFRLPDGRPPMAVLQLGSLDDVVRPIAAAAIVRLARDLSQMAGSQIPLMLGIDAVDQLMTDGDGSLARLLAQKPPSGLGLCICAEDQTLLPQRFVTQASVTISHHLQRGEGDTGAAEVRSIDAPYPEWVMINRLKPAACPHAMAGADRSVPPSREDVLATILEAWQG